MLPRQPRARLWVLLHVDNETIIHLANDNETSRSMNALLKDRQPTVVHIDTDIIRATKGLQEFFARPPVVSYPTPPMSGQA